ncbi:MAG: hypothetical protein Q8941_06925 [Bacteroidota bacterium]|nr:hypothetical protein [Bacteroidota bacterium]
MNKIFRNNRLMMIAFFTVFSVAAAPAMANDSSNPVPVELKLIGNINHQPLYQLSFAGNAEENDFTIIVRDEDGNSLYRENIKGENFYKKFLLNNDEPGNDILRFEITSKRSHKTVVFEINRQSRFTGEMAISKIK